jgi:choline-sulfatase
MRLRTECAGITEIPESKIQDVVVAQESLAFIREHQHSDPDHPWFLCASFSRPHFPLTAPRRFFERYWPDGVTPPKVAATGDAYDHPMSVGMRKGFKTEDIPEEEMMRARAAYFACVDYFDEVIGDLLMRLEADGLLNNTIIVYASDHGEMAGEHGTWWKNGWYEACTHVPLIISTPEQRRGETPAGRCSVPVSLADLFPTFCGFADVERPEGLDGEDLSAVVNGVAEAPDRPVFTDALIPRWGEGTEFRSIRWRHYKYVTFHGHPPLFFDLEADPAEQTNLVETAEGKAAEALATLKRIASESIDFEEAERERIERDGALAQQHKLEVPKTPGSNMYLMPSGKVVAADDTIYAPQVVTDNPADVFGDWPG